MTNIDQFESVFNSADKPIFHLDSITLRDVLLVTDLDADAAARYLEDIKSFFAQLEIEPAWNWGVITGDQYASVGELLQRIGEHNPDMICTYRNLHTPATEYPHSLGTYVDVMTQNTQNPVLLVPHPSRRSKSREVLVALNEVMALTDHLTGDHLLASFGAYFTHSQGTLFLAHLEDQGTFERYVDTISRIPALDTDVAREAILQQLLKEPREYIESCRGVLTEKRPSLKVEPLISIGQRVADCHRLIAEHGIDLLVLNTKDEDQMAMHGLAYPLTVELRDIPILML